ncbi:MAG: DNA-processing protein DprA [Acidimicrobiia bacterium]
MKTLYQNINNPTEIFHTLKICSPNVSQLNVLGTNHELLSDAHANIRIGIVGTRNATQSGINITRKIAQVLGLNGFVTVSGMALGIDSAAHQGSLDSGGKTIAVLGSGVNVIYPQRNKKLYDEIIKNGIVISEYDNDTSPLAFHFPVRNRIIAALSDILIVTEGTLKGGARITVDLALSMGKTICAIPGPIKSHVSELPNAIIADGAISVLDPSDLLSLLDIDSKALGWNLKDFSKIQQIEISTTKQRIIDTLSCMPSSMNELSEILSISSTSLNREIYELEKAELIRYHRGKYEAI